MFPRSSIDNAFNGAYWYPYDSGNPLGTKPAGNVQILNIPNHLVSENAFSVHFSPSLIDKKSTFGNGIKDVFPLRPEKEMVGVATASYVTSVTNAHSDRNGSVRDLPRYSMRGPRPSVQHKVTVLFLRTTIRPTLKTSLPYPTFVRTTNIHLAPEPFFSRLSSHRSDGLICAKLPARQSAGAFSYSISRKRY